MSYRITPHSAVPSSSETRPGRLTEHGYPDGVADEDIPRPVRRFALVNVYDVLTTARP